MADGDVKIRWFAVPNENKTRGGFMPMYEQTVDDGKTRIRGTSYGRGYDRDEAEALAKAEAESEASHYSGDWNISVEKRSSEGGFATLGAMAAIATLGGVVWFGRGLLTRRGRS